MAMTLEQFKEKVKAIQRADTYSRKAAFFLPAGTPFFADSYSLRENKKDAIWILEEPHLVHQSDLGVDGGWHAVEGINSYGKRLAHSQSNKEKRLSGWLSSGYVYISWDAFWKNTEIRKAAIEWINKVTPNFEVSKNKGVISFVNKKTKEKLRCDLNAQEFIRSYKKGKDRKVRYPAQYFKYVSGRLLLNKIEDEDCTNFKTLVELVAQNYRSCRNFGTFLVKMFDHIHLETYISAGVDFRFDNPFSYADFDKDIRNKLNEHNITYDSSVASLFCSEKDTGRAIFAQIKNKVGFKNMVRILAYGIQEMNTLVNHYHYDLKTLFAYCRERNWRSNQYRFYATTSITVNPEEVTQDVNTYEYDILRYLRDYSRMALDVYGEAYEKYPADLPEAHDACNALYKVRKLEIDAKKFEELIDKSLEWSNKDFVILYPKKPEEVVQEGAKLRHCVGSYIQSVVRGECKIIFLRKKDDLEKPFVTIEIVGGGIRQARGFGNSTPPYDARMFLKDYAKEKKLVYVG